MPNYQSLIVAGVGAIGDALLRLKLPVLESFQDVVAVDTALRKPVDVDIRFAPGDIRDPGFLSELLSRVPLPAIVVNLAPGVDTVALRRSLAGLPVAYLDSSGSELPGVKEHRMSRIMRYTLTDVSTHYPHWVCWGTNPGLVELIARSAVEQHGFSLRGNRVEVSERDWLTLERNKGFVPVSWSPHDLIEEVMRAPMLRVRDYTVEEHGTRSQSTVVHWDHQPIRSWIVAHEDIWNLGRLNWVESAQFSYALAPAVMEALAGNAADAEKHLRIPSANEPVNGDERLRVSVDNRADNKRRTWEWREDHADVWRRWRMNAVQYQVGTSLAFALEVLQSTEKGRQPGTYSASTLPIADNEWPLLWRLMRKNGIRWESDEGRDILRVI